MLRDDAGATPSSLRGTAVACAVTAWPSCDAAVDMRACNAVIEEVPVALVYNGISHAVMLASPADLEDFAIGFSLSEGIVEKVHEVHDLEVVASGDGIEVRLVIASQRMAALKERRRALAGRTGCGLCGVETLAQAVRPARVVAASSCHAVESNGGGEVASSDSGTVASRGDKASRTTSALLTAQALNAAIASLTAQQSLHQATGAAHAAGFADRSGRLRLLREDVGRHNALDKLIGAMAKARIDGAQGFAVVTSRASYEMVHKTASAGIPVLAALSAPTALAVRTAHQAGLTLIGNAGRHQRWVYSHPERMVMD